MLVLTAASRLIQGNVDVLMDRTPATAREAALAAIEELGPGVQLRRLRMRRAAGRHFADVVIGVPHGAAVEQGHAAADAVERAVEQAVPGADVIVHVEPQEAEAIRERAYAAALREPRVREVHNIVVLEVGGRTEISLHLKLPGGYPLADAHEVASSVEHEILDALPEVDAVQTHLEPLTEPTAASAVPEGERAAEAEALRQIVVEATGRRAARASPPEHRGRARRLPHACDGPEPSSRRGACPGERRRGADPAGAPEFADVVVHTEP